MEFETSKKVWEFRKESRITLDANKVGVELEEIQNNNINKQLLPPDVVEYAKSHTDSELYKGFEWDKEKASYEYWLIQARQIIYNIRVVKLEHNSEPSKSYSIKVMPYVHVPGEKGYQATSVVVQNKDSYEKLKQKAYNDLLYWQEKYSMITELEDIFKAIKELKI